MNILRGNLSRKTRREVPHRVPNSSATRAQFGTASRKGCLKHFCDNAGNDPLCIPTWCFDLKCRDIPYDSVQTNLKPESHLVGKVEKEHHLLASTCHWFPAHLRCFLGGPYQKLQPPPVDTALSGPQSDLSHGPPRNHRPGVEENSSAQKATFEF